MNFNPVSLLSKAYQYNPMAAIGLIVCGSIFAIALYVFSRPKPVVGAQLPKAKVLTPAEVLPHIKTIAKIITDNKLLDQEGIFRISGSHDSIEPTVDRIKQNKKVNLDTFKVHELTGIFKKLLRDNQLVPESTRVALIGAIDKKNDDATNVRQVKEAVNAIKDPAVKACLKECFLLLANVASCHEKNKMEASNLGISVGQSIFPSNSIEAIDSHNNLTAFMVEHASEIF